MGGRLGWHRRRRCELDASTRVQLSELVTLDLSAELVVRARLVRLQTFQPVLVKRILD
jgi:hypothetical protein